MRVLMIALALILAGCGSPAPYRAATITTSAVDKALVECKLDATKATANIRNGIEAGWMQGTIERQCMQSKGYTR